MSQVIQVSSHQVSTVLKVSSQSPGQKAAASQSQLSGHSQVTAVTVFRSWSCGHAPKDIPLSLQSGSTVTTCPATLHFKSNKMRNKFVKQVNGNGKNSLLISHWNLGSKKWTNKRNLIQAQVDTDKPDLIFISEANLDELTPLHESLITGYTITMPKSVTINGTARIVLLTRDSLEFTVMDKLMDDTVSSIWIRISRRGMKSLLLCGVYREHQYLNQVNDWSLQPLEQIKRWSQFLRQVETARLTAVCHIIGDVNLDYMKWNTPDYSQLQMITDSKNTLEAGGFYQLIKEVTRSWPGQVDSLIDHYWTNDPQKILSVSNAVRAVGDHNLISARIRLKGSDVRRLDTRKRSYRNFDPAVYRQNLEAENWLEIYSINDVNLANDFLESRIVKVLDTMCPYKTIQHRTNVKTWLKNTTKDAMTARDTAREIARRSGDPEDWKHYRTLRNQVNRQVTLDKKCHYDDIYKRLDTNNDVGALYKTAKTQAGMNKNTSPTSFLQEGVRITDPQVMADIQLDTFVEKTEKLVREVPPPLIDPCELLIKTLDNWGPKKDERSMFSFKTIDKIDTLKIMKELGNTTSSAHDRMDNLALKHGATILHGPVTHIINLSIKTSTFATKWKIGKLLPLHKGKGLHLDDPKSYRPISLLPIIGKMTERALQKQILEFMEESGQINPDIHSYRKHHSTVTAMLQLSDAIFSGCNLKNITTLVTLDKSAAFDVLCHKILMRKLKLYNFDKGVLDWIQSYLSHRRQYVSIGTRNSHYSSITTGVPQGSVLGPILYIIYVNELPSILNKTECTELVHAEKTNLFTDNCAKCGFIPTYADDSTIVITSSNRYEAQEQIIDTTDKIKIFLDANSLSLNLGKTEILETMVRQKRVRLPGFQKNDGTLKVITANETCRLLGANLDRDITWNHHLETGEKPLFTTLRSTLGILTHLSRYLPQKSRLLLSNGLFISRILYLLPMWGGIPNKDTLKLQRLLNKCARMILDKGRRTRTRTLMIGCGWLYIKELIKFHSAVQVYKIINFKKPRNLCNKFTLDAEKRISTSVGRLKIVRQSFRWRAITIWNDLPDSLRNAPILSIFKKTLKKHLIESRSVTVPRPQTTTD